MIKNVMGALNMLKGKFSGNTDEMVAQAVGMMAPLMEQFTAAYDKPVEEGGLLEKEDFTCCFSVVKTKVKNEGEEDVWTHLPYVFVLAYDAESSHMYIRKRIPFLSLIHQKQQEPESPAATGGKIDVPEEQPAQGAEEPININNTTDEPNQ